MSYLDKVTVGSTTYDIQDSKAQADVADLKSALTNTKNEIYNRSNVFSRFVSGGRNSDGSPKPSAARATCDTLFRLNAGDVLSCSGNATGQKFGIGGDCDDGTYYDSGWKTADFSYTVAKSGLYYVNAAMSNGTDTINPGDVTLSVTITDNTSRIAQNSDAISAMDAVCGYGDRITSSNYATKLPDFNSANTNTIYNIFNCLTSISNYPSDCDYQSGTLITMNGRETDTNWTLQLFATKKDSKSTIYFRYCIDSSWLGWAKLPGDVDLVRNANTEIKDHFVATSVSRDVVIDSNTKILGFGDSIMQGYSQITKNWLGLVVDDVGCTVVNKAIGGACFGESVAASNYWISTQISGVTETEWNNATLIIVAAGTNDAGNSTTLSDLKTKVQSAITSIKAATDAPILFITPIRRGSSASDANLLKLPGIAGVIANVALANGCSVINGFDFPIATYDIDQVSDMTIDHLHPNNTGTAVYAQTLLSIIK